MTSPPRMISTAPGTSLRATIGHGSQHEKASMPLESSATVMSGGGVFTSVTSPGARPAFSSSARMYRWLMVPKEAAIFLPWSVFKSLVIPAPSRAMTAIVASEPSLVATMAVIARDDCHRRVGAELGRVAAVIAERDEIHAAQDCANHRHADLHQLALAGLQRIERVDAGRIRPRDAHVETPLLEEPALQRDRQPDLIDAGHHAGLELHRGLGLGQRERWRDDEQAKQQNCPHHDRSPPRGSTFVTQ